MSKAAKDYIPYCQDQGIPYLTGAGKAGVSTQYKANWPMPAGGVFVFEDEDLTNMASDDYAVIVQNQTDIADPATVGSKLATGFTVTGPDAADELDILIIGPLVGQKV